MQKPTYSQIITLVNELTEAHHQKSDRFDPYASVAGCLTSILGMVVAGSITKREAVRFLEDAVVKAKKG